MIIFTVATALLLFDPAAVAILARQLPVTPIVDVAPAARPVTLSPLVVLLAGAGVDAASTYHALSQGHGVEGNALYQGLSPLATATSVAVSGPLLHWLVQTVSPRLARAVSAQLGARQLALGGENFYGVRQGSSSEGRVTQQLAPRRGR